MNASVSEPDIRKVVLSALASVAPEVDGASLSPSAPLRDQVDLDSFDWLHFLLDLHERMNIEIPEADYAQLTTLDRIVAYVQARQS